MIVISPLVFPQIPPFFHLDFVQQTIKLLLTDGINIKDFFGWKLQMVSHRNKLWDKIIGKSETKHSTVPAHLKTATIKITVISKGDKV